MASLGHSWSVLGGSSPLLWEFQGHSAGWVPRCARWWWIRAWMGPPSQRHTACRVSQVISKTCQPTPGQRPMRKWTGNNLSNKVTIVAIVFKNLLGHFKWAPVSCGSPIQFPFPRGSTWRSWSPLLQSLEPSRAAWRRRSVWSWTMVGSKEDVPVGSSQQIGAGGGCIRRMYLRFTCV